MATAIVSKRARKPTPKKSEGPEESDPEYSQKLFTILTNGSPQIAQTLRELIDAAFESVQAGVR
jgi:hypothetical protein